jgi:hypothetical protein
MNNTQDLKIEFSIETQTSVQSIYVTALTTSFDWNENLVLGTLHFYSRKYEIKLGSVKKPQPSRVLYIDPSKRLNDYYAASV